MRWCAARAERLRHQRRDKLFSAQDSGRFLMPQRRKARCSKLASGGETVQDPDRLLQIWVECFGRLAELRLGESSDGVDRRENMKMLELQSHMNEEYLLDVPFTAQEVSKAVVKLKEKKAPGSDGLLAEHLKAGGEAVMIWLRNILIAIQLSWNLCLQF